MQSKNYVQFTEEMKKNYTILVPNMLPIHFNLICGIFRKNGYNVVLLNNSGPHIAETGLKWAHNDTCYPAIVVIGQFMDAVLSGQYDMSKTALLMFQTGGGCRASNYISLIRKALKKANLENVPVISFNFSGMENHPGFKISPVMLHKMMYAVFYGDLIMSLKNQTLPYENNPGDSEKLAYYWADKLGKELGDGGAVKYKKVLENYRNIILDFSNISITKTNKPKVGIVGEIFVKYSPLANNNLEEFLIKEGAEAVVPGLVDFCLYTAYNNVLDTKLYKTAKLKGFIWNIVYKFLNKKKNDVIKYIKQYSNFEPWTEFDKIIDIPENLISTAVKMGEGWLLTAEMLELANNGCKNIVCTQPFGCLPNHICGKGMMKPLKEIKPDINIVAIDYDSGASRVNQENRLKLMLANAN